MARIVIPSNFLEQEKLVGDINTQHTALGAASPLTPFDVAGIVTKTSDARTYHDDAVAKSKQAEDLYEDRDNEMNPAIKEVRRWAQFLKQIHKDNPHELGNWGFVVDDSVQDDEEEEPPTP
jgi:hypothetical protein